MDVTQDRVNQLAYEIVGCAIEVHKHLGPGLLELIYEKCMVEELHNCGLKVRSQVPVPINYKGKQIEQVLSWISW